MFINFALVANLQNELKQYQKDWTKTKQSSGTLSQLALYQEKHIRWTQTRFEKCD